MRNDKIEELFVAGLLHDIGKIVEMMFLPEEFLKVTRHVRQKNTLMHVAEQQLLGYTHAEVENCWENAGTCLPNSFMLFYIITSPAKPGDMRLNLPSCIWLIFCADR